MQRENIEKNPVPTRTKTKTIKKCEDKRLKNYISSESEGNLVETQHVSLTWFIPLLMSLLSQIPFFRWRIFDWNRCNCKNEIDSNLKWH